MGFDVGPKLRAAGVIVAGAAAVTGAAKPVGFMLGCNLSSMPSLLVSVKVPVVFTNLAEAAAGAVAVPYCPNAGLYCPCCFFIPPIVATLG